MMSVAKWLGLLAFAVVGVVAVARLGQENFWFAPAALALVVLRYAASARQPSPDCVRA
jgi:uncharacterized membrane protein YoaK (UPF0700 family)